MKRELELEKEPDNFRLCTPYTTGFAPKTQEHSQENLTGKSSNSSLSPHKEVQGAFYKLYKSLFLTYKRCGAKSKTNKTQ